MNKRCCDIYCALAIGWTFKPHGGRITQTRLKFSQQRSTAVDRGDWRQGVAMELELLH